MMKRIVLITALLLLILEIIIIAPKEIGVSSRPDSPLLAQTDTATAQQSMRGVHLVEAKNEKKEWELWSDQAFTKEGADVWLLQNVKIRFFGEGEAHYIVTGETGEVNVKTKDIRIAGKVQMVSSNGYRFRTEHLSYRADTRIIDTSDPVMMNGGEGRGEHPVEVKGTGLSANMNTNEIEILKDVRSKKELESKEYVYIESNRVQLSANDRYAKYIGEVTVDYKGSRITGPTARFDYDPTLKAVTSMLVEGGARVTDLSKWATAKTIQMLFRENKFILKGAPRVVQDNDELVGEEITLLDGGKEIVVNRAKANFIPKSQ